jgi:divalent metal cation (Fe/Co/Zn/Cd) transporter
MLPIIPVIAARAGWFVAGAVAGALIKSKIGKEAVDGFKEGIKGMGEDYRRDMTDKDKADIAKKERMVKDIREGRQ